MSPPSQSLYGGNSVSVSLSANGANGFASQISVQVSGVPAGVSVAPATITLVPGSPQQVTLTAPANVAYDSATITFSGAAGSLTNTASLNLSLISTVGTPGRTRYVRTDATTEYFVWPNQNWVVYNPPASRFFVTDPTGNHVIALDATSETEVGTISVPGAYGIDDTPDHTALYVATLIGDVYEIDPVSMTVTQRYIASQIGPNGYLPFDLQVLADGQLALLGYSGGVLGVDGVANFAVWNPHTNAFVVYGGNGKSMPCVNIFEFVRSTDRSKVIVGGGTQFLCEIDEASGNITSVQAPATGNFIITPDGNHIVVPAANNGVASVNIYDANTLSLTSTLNLNVQQFDAVAYVTSTDSTTLFLLTDSFIYAYTITTGQPAGWLPNIYLSPISGGLDQGLPYNPNLQAADDTGLFLGPMEEGVGFVDLSTLNALPLGTPFNNAYLNPAAGPVSGGTQVQNLPTLSTKQGAIYFGSQQATSASTSASPPSVTTPPASPGTIAIYAFLTDGSEQFIPDGFSYGPTVLEVTPNLSTLEGGGSGFVYGYGLGPVDSDAIPPDLQINVSGTSAQITGYSPAAYGVSPYPFQLEFAEYTVPPGASGTASVTVTNSYGTTTVPGGFTYLPATQQFPLAGSSLAQGIYDSYTNLYYFTDTNKIQIFSRPQGQWFSPISMPAPPGATQRLWGIALSPNGNLMAVSDAMAGVIYLFNPSSTTSVKTFTIPQTDLGFFVNPCGLAVSDTGNIYYWIFGGADGADQFFKLNTHTGATTDYGINGPSTRNDNYLRDVISSDNSSVYFNEEGNLFRVDTATDKLYPASVGVGCCGGDFELALAANQEQVSANSYIYDAKLNGESYYALNDREDLNIQYYYGAKFSPDGRLLFQPSTIGIDVLDGNLGHLLNRISLPFALSPNYDALVSDGTDNLLIAITGPSGNGIAVVDLTSIPEPSALPYLHKARGKNSAAGQPEDRQTGGNRFVSYAKTRTVQSHSVPYVTKHATEHSEEFKTHFP